MWGAGGLSALVAAAGGGLLIAAPAAHGDVSPGVGNSYAQSIQDTPKDGSLAVGVVLGEAIAGHTNDVARAQSQGLDETAIGTSLQGYNCGTAPSPSQVSLVPQPLQAETGSPGADKGVTVTPTDGLTTESQSQLVPTSFGSTEFVQATEAPYGLADTSYGSVSVPGAPFTVSGTESRAWSGVKDGQRVAAASEDIGSINLGGGMVVINGLHWDVSFPSGGTGTPTGNFSIGSLTIKGVPIPTSNPASALAQANTVLGAIGLNLGIPTKFEQQGIEFVTPLELDVISNPTRDNVVDPVTTQLGAIADPVEGQLEAGGSSSLPQQLQAAICQTDTPITVADIAIASLNGGGSYVTSFGGVNATSGNAPSNPFNLNLPAFGLPPGQTQFIPGTSGTPAIPGSAAAGSGTGGSTLGGTQNSGTGQSSTSGGQPSGSVQSAEPIATTATVAGGPLLGIGLGGLGALLLLAEGDRRMMRRASRGGAKFADFED